MRIIAGKHRGRRIEAPPGEAVRPTSDRMRQALFNILAHRFLRPDGTPELIGARVLDGFAGSGALGLEALSRGADHACFMDKDPAAILAIGENLRGLGEGKSATVLRCDAANPPPARQACSIALLDPPYRSGLAGPALLALQRQGWLAKGALITVEEAAKEPFAPPDGFELLDERRYGAGRLIFLRAP